MKWKYGIGIALWSCLVAFGFATAEWTRDVVHGMATGFSFGALVVFLGVRPWRR